MPTLCFGDISRDEINTVLNIAGVSLTPPKKVSHYKERNGKLGM
jgi:hypothetical protein